MASIKEVSINDLVQVQVTVNNNHLFSTLKSIIATLNDHTASINRLREQAFQSSKSDLSWQEIIHDLSGQVKSLQTENKSYKERLNDMERQIDIYQTESKVRAERHHEELQEVFTKVRLDKETTASQVNRIQVEFASALNETKVSLNRNIALVQSELNERITEETTKLDTKITNDISTQVAILKDSSDNHKYLIDKMGQDIVKIHEEIPAAANVLRVEIDDLRKDMLDMVEARKVDHVANLTRIQKIYDVIHIDMEALNEPTTKGKYRLIHEDELNQKKQEQQQAPVIAPPTIIYQEAPVVQKKQKKKEDKKKEEKEEKKETPMDNDATVKMMLNTPTFVELKRQIFLQIDQLRSDHQEFAKLQENENIKTGKEMKEQLARLVSKQDLEVAISNHEQMIDLTEMARRHERHLEHIFTNYWNKEQVWEALRLKADEKNLELKADRKFVNGLFDYLNEKVNSLMGDGPNEELFNAIQQLEEQLQEKADKRDLMFEMEKTPLFNPIMQSFEIIDPPLLVNREMNSDGNGAMRCLSCNKPLTASSKNRSPPRTMIEYKKREREAQELSDLPNSSRYNNSFQKRAITPTDECTHEIDDLQEVVRPSSAEKAIDPSKFNLNLNLMSLSSERPAAPNTAPSRSRRVKLQDSARKADGDSSATVEQVVSARMEKGIATTVSLNSLSRNLRKKLDKSSPSPVTKVSKLPSIL